jgi:hypothetical protein
LYGGVFGTAGAANFFRHSNQARMSNNRGTNGNNGNWQWHPVQFPGPSQPTGQSQHNPQQAPPPQQGTLAPQILHPTPVRTTQSLQHLLSPSPQQPTQQAPMQQAPMQQAPMQLAPTQPTTHSTYGISHPPRVDSPGGTAYQQNPPPKPKKDRREAAGYKNPSHDHDNMIPLWRDAALSPIPFPQGSQQEKTHLMDSQRHFRTRTPNGTRTEDIQDHSNGILGHKPDASEDWNNHGHKRSRAENSAHNRETTTYHGIETKARSNQSGSSAQRYMIPDPTTGSHPSHWKTTDPGFKNDVPWPTWTPVSTQNNSSHTVPTQGSTGYGHMPSVQQPQRPQNNGSSSVIRQQQPLSQMQAPPQQHQQFAQQSLLSPMMYPTGNSLAQDPVLSQFMMGLSQVQQPLQYPAHGQQPPQQQFSLFSSQNPFQTHVSQHQLSMQQQMQMAPQQPFYVPSMQPVQQQVHQQQQYYSYPQPQVQQHYPSPFGQQQQAPQHFPGPFTQQQAPQHFPNLFTQQQAPQHFPNLFTQQQAPQHFPNLFTQQQAPQQYNPFAPQHHFQPSHQQAPQQHHFGQFPQQQQPSQQHQFHPFPPQ